MASSGFLIVYSLLNVLSFWYLLIIKTNTFSLLKTASKVTLLPVRPEEAHKSPISLKWPPNLKVIHYLRVIPQRLIQTSV